VARRGSRRARADAAHALVRDNPALRSLEYVVVDVETTGGPADRGHRITEVCAVRMSSTGVVLEEVNTLINPERAIPPGITRLTNISSDMVRSAPRFADVASALHRIMRGRVFVAHNAGFDWNFLAAEMTRVNAPVPRAPILCTIRLARKLVPEVRSKSLDALTFFFNIRNEARHRAFGDARATAVVLHRMLERACDLEVHRWAELEELMVRRRRRPRKVASPVSLEQVQLDFPVQPELDFDVHPPDDLLSMDVAPTPAYACVAESAPDYGPIDASHLAAYQALRLDDPLSAAVAFLNRVMGDRLKRGTAHGRPEA
jgi:DNA polymerase III epsilon subunit family exonuclease